MSFSTNSHFFTFSNRHMHKTFALSKLLASYNLQSHPTSGCRRPPNLLIRKIYQEVGKTYYK